MQRSSNLSGYTYGNNNLNVNMNNNNNNTNNVVNSMTTSNNGNNNINLNNNSNSNNLNIMTNMNTISSMNNVPNPSLNTITGIQKREIESSSPAFQIPGSRSPLMQVLIF